MRRAASVALAAVFVFLGVVLAPSASAIGIPGVPDCKSAPTPEVPGRGVVGFFNPTPKTLPPEADPFAPHSTTSIYEQYGYAGLTFNTYDLGCGPDLARDPSAVTGAAVANWVLLLPTTIIAATGAVLTAAFGPDFLAVLDPLIARVVNGLTSGVWGRWYILVLAALGVWVIARARRADLSSTASAIGWAMLVMVLVTMVFRWPLVAPHATDAASTAVLGSVTASLADHTGTTTDAGVQATSVMHDSILYQAWLVGTFGSATSATALRYGPVVFDATALTWRQAAVLRDDPAAGKAIITAKQAAFTQAAAEIQDSDPDAYGFLTGHRSADRVGAAAFAAFASVCACGFLIVAGLLMIGSMLVIRFGVMLFPAVATLGLFPTMRHLVTGIASTMVAAIINSTIFGVSASVLVAAMGYLFGSGLPLWLAIILTLLMTVVAWVSLAPFRRLTQMVGQREHFADAIGGVSAAGRRVRGNARRTLVAAAGAAMGGAAGALVVEHLVDEVPAEAPARAEAEPAMTEPPGPIPDEVRAESGVQVAPTQQTWPAPPNAPVAATELPESAPADATDLARWELEAAT